ncbi:signal peptidase I [Williamsia sp. R60]
MSHASGDVAATQTKSHRLREVALTAAALAGLTCILMATAAMLFGIKPLIVRSGSMEPAIPTGALAIAKHVPAGDIKADDVISVINEQGIRVTHRVVSVDSTASDAAAMTLKGDANRVPDSQPYVISSAERVVFHVDGLGYAAAWLDTPAAKILGGLTVAGLLWITVFPHGRKRSGDQSQAVHKRRGRHAAEATPPLIVLGIAVALVITIGNARGTSAAYSDSATAQTGSFSANSSFVPRINSLLTIASYVTCSTSGPGSARVVTLNWKHIGPPYQYRILLRDLEGNVWRTVDVSPTSTTAAGATVTATFGATGFPVRAVPWEYNAEIHTMLPGGAVSPDWRGHRVYQDSTTLLRENLTCSGIGEVSGSSTAYIPPPASVSCATNATQKTATVSWPHRSGYNYRLIVRDPTTRNIAYTAEVDPALATPAGQSISRTIAFSDLTPGILTGTAANVEIRTKTRELTPTQSTEFVTQQITASSANGVACVAPAPAARLGAPTSTAVSTASSAAASTTPSGTTATTSPTGSSTATPDQPTTTTTQSTIAADQPLSPAITSSSGNYSATLIQTSSGSVVVVIRDAGGTEAYRTTATASDSLQWLASTDDLRVTGPTGTWTISRESGAWVKTPYAEPAVPVATTQPVSPTTTEAPR